MKTKIYLTAAIALVISACTSGSYITSGYGDDIYFNPADIPPPVVAEETPQQEPNAPNEGVKSPDRVIISEITDNNEGSKTMNNYIYDGKDAKGYTDAQVYNMDQQDLQQTDTTVYYDDNQIKYVINNYYDASDVDFTHRLRMFHSPYFYDPFYWNDWYGDSWYWDSWYYPYSSMYWGLGWNNWGWGYSPWYSGWYGGGYGFWGSPYGYYGMGGWGYPYYAWGGSYYNNYWGGSYVNSEDYRYGKRRDYNTSVAGGGGRGYDTRTSAINNERSPLKSTISRGDGVSVNDPADRRANSISGAGNGGRSVRQESQVTTEGRTLTEMRRNNVDATTTRNRASGSTVTRSIPGNRQTNVTGNGVQTQSTTSRRYSGSQNQYTRPSTIQGRSTNTYTPSYNQQRSANRSTYNIQEYSRPSGSTGNQSGQMKSAQRSTTVYSRPSGSSGSDRSYRSGSTYNRSSSSGTNYERTYSEPSGSSRNTYSEPSRSSGSTYSAPSRSSGSYSSGGGGYSGGSSSSGGGGSQSSGGGGTSHSGRR